MTDGTRGDTSREGITCIGNCILDVVHTMSAWPQQLDLARITAQKTALGGGAANVASNLVSMGPAIRSCRSGWSALGCDAGAVCLWGQTATDRLKSLSLL